MVTVADIIIVIVAALLLIFSFFWIFFRRKKGAVICDGKCSRCPYVSSCGQQSFSEKNN